MRNPHSSRLLLQSLQTRLSGQLQILPQGHAATGALYCQLVSNQGYASPASSPGDKHAAAAIGSVKAAPTSSAAAIGVVSLGAAAIGYYLWSAEKEADGVKGSRTPKRDPDARPGVASAPHVPLPEFNLTSHKGQPLSKEQLLGDFALLYLGSLANADHTKESLERMIHIVQQQDRRTNMHMLQPVFLPLDQESASPDKLKDFMGHLDKQGKTGLRLLAATGPDVRKVADAALTHSAKAGEQGKNESDYSDTGLLYLVHPKGEIILQFSADADVASIVDTIAEQAKDYKALNPGWHGPKAIKERHA